MRRPRRAKPPLRISIFNRDKYTCQYCGRRAPEVILHLEHIRSRFDGGSDHPSNLVTSCQSCNLQKAHRSLLVSELSPKQVKETDQAYEDCHFLNFKILSDYERGTVKPRRDFEALMFAVRDADDRAFKAAFITGEGASNETAEEAAIVLDAAIWSEPGDELEWEYSL